MTQNTISLFLLKSRAGSGVKYTKHLSPSGSLVSVLQSKLWLPGTSEAQSSGNLPEVFQKAGEERDPAALPLRSQSRGGLGAREEETQPQQRDINIQGLLYRRLLLGQGYRSLHKCHFWDLALGLRGEKKKVQ